LNHNAFAIDKLPKNLDLKYLAKFTGSVGHPCVLFDFDLEKIYEEPCASEFGMSDRGEEVNYLHAKPFPKLRQLDVTRTVLEFLNDKTQFITDQFDFQIDMGPPYAVYALQFSDYSILRYFVSMSETVNHLNEHWEFQCYGQRCNAEVYDEFDHFINDLVDLGVDEDY
jgi:hypothetical protein